MPKQQQAFVTLLRQMGYQAITSPPRPRLDTMPPDARAMVVDLYRKLNGVQPEPRLTPGSWDSSFEGGLVVEYDESQHFNRYRAMTLQRDWAHALPWRRSYLDYCATHEFDCTTARGWGGYWSKGPAERLFGAPGPERDLEGVGSPRWRQRALYDAMRDVAALYGNVRLARLAVYDEINGVALGRALGRAELLDRDALRSLIIKRTLGT